MMNGVIMGIEIVGWEDIRTRNVTDNIVRKFRIIQDWGRDQDQTADVDTRAWASS